MKEEVKPKRRYNSAQRQAQAQVTRQAIMDAARRLFLQRGYNGTTMEAIAAEAEVAVDTIYAVFRTKRALLARLLDIAVVGDEEPVPLLERAEVQAVSALPDGREQVRRFAEQITGIVARTGPLFGVMRAAAESEPEIAALMADIERQRLTGMTHFAEILAGGGSLREGLDVAVAAETLWAICSPDVHRQLSIQLGWTSEKYGRWLADTLARVLLPA